MKSVTRILKKYFPFPDTIPEHILENARKRGNAVHKYVENYNNYILGKRKDKPVTDLEYLIYADYYEEFVKKHNFKPVHNELKLNDGVIVGVIDMVGYVDGVLSIVDLKVTAKLGEKYVELQNSAYKHLAIHNKIVNDKDIPIKVLHFNTKDWTLKDLNDRYDIFEKMIEVDEYL